MCGIVAYNGSESCKKKLLEGLEQLEYRGYDSAGIALLNENSIDVIKKSGNIDGLIEKANNDPSEANIGIGHTRWATHGKPTEENAHPHVNNKKDIAIVHNGIIENYQILKEDLIKDGYSFYSETDSEVIANLIDKYYEKDLSTSVKKVADLLEGSFSLAVISSRDPETLVLVRKESPLILGIIDNGVFAASDITAILNYTRDVIYLDDEEIVTIKDGKYKIELKDKEVNKEIIHVDMSVEAASKNGYDHFMIKEIHEQPKVIEDSLIRKIKGDFIMTDLNPIIADRFTEHLEVFGKTMEHMDTIQEIGYRCKAALENGNKILFCGNGGSAADSQHLAAELICRFKKERRSLAGIALTTDTSALTAIANDYDFESVFARQVEGLGRTGDVLIGISTSGNSKNVVKAAEMARSIGMHTIAFTGEGGGKLAELCDITLAIPSNVTARIQEMHILAGHIMCEIIEEDY